MAKRPEKSDGRVVPEGARKDVQTAAMRGGKATTASEKVGQLELSFETAAYPQGAEAKLGADQAAAGMAPVPKSSDTSSNDLPAMTMEEVASDENLIRAFEAVARNKGAAGPDGQSIEQVRERLREVLVEMKRELLAGRYQPGMIRRVWIPKPGGGERGLGIPDVVDRIVQQAVHQVLSPHYEPTFHDGSHGFRPGRSCHTAIEAAKKHLSEGYEWVVDLDLEKFFDRVHHERLVARLQLRIKDPRLIQLIRRMLKAKVVMPDGVVVATEEGTPQGGPLSPLLSNIVLDELDRELEQRGHHFVRYADDANIYVRSERAGQRVMANIVGFIERRLRLKVNAAKSAVAKAGQRHFVGFTVRRSSNGRQIKVGLSERSRDRFDAKIRALTPRCVGWSFDACIKQVNQYLRGWMNFFGSSLTVDVNHKLKMLDGHIRRRLRVVLLKQWKRRRSIARRLTRIGVQGRTAWRVVYEGRKSPWALSYCNAVDHALGRAYFQKRGLLSLQGLFWEMVRSRRLARAQAAGETH